MRNQDSSRDFHIDIWLRYNIRCFILQIQLNLGEEINFHANKYTPIETVQVSSVTNGCY